MLEIIESFDAEEEEEYEKADGLDEPSELHAEAPGPETTADETAETETAAEGPDTATPEEAPEMIPEVESAAEGPKAEEEEDLSWFKEEMEEEFPEVPREEEQQQPAETTTSTSVAAESPELAPEANAEPAAEAESAPEAEPVAEPEAEPVAEPAVAEPAAEPETTAPETTAPEAPSSEEPTVPEILEDGTAEEVAETVRDEADDHTVSDMLDEANDETDARLLDESSDATKAEILRDADHDEQQKVVDEAEQETVKELVDEVSEETREEIADDAEHNETPETAPETETETASLAGHAVRRPSAGATLAMDSSRAVGASVSNALSDETFDARVKAMYAEAKGRYEAAAERARHEALERYVQSATRSFRRSEASSAAAADATAAAAAGARAEASLGRKARAGGSSSAVAGLGAVEDAEALEREREIGLRRVSRAQDVCTRPLGKEFLGRSGFSDVIKRHLFEIHFKHESGLAADVDADVTAAKGTAATVAADAAAAMGLRRRRSSGESVPEYVATDWTKAKTTPIGRSSSTSRDGSASESRAVSFPARPVEPEEFKNSVEFKNSELDYGASGATFHIPNAAETWAAEHADYGAEGPEKVNRHKWAANAQDPFKMYDYEAPEPEKTGFRRAPAEKSGRRWLP